MPMSHVVQAILISVVVYPFRSSRREVGCLGFNHFYKHISQCNWNRRITCAFWSFRLLLWSCMMVVAPVVAISSGVVANLPMDLRRLIPLLPNLDMIHWLRVALCLLEFMHILLHRSGHLVECNYRRAICICQPSFHWFSCVCNQCLDNFPFWDV